MSQRVFNFCAGPCTLPLEALEEAQAEFVDFKGAGMSLIEMSHRAKEYDAVHQEALALLREVFGAPAEFEPLLIQGGATLQFAMIPLNLLTPGAKAGYVMSGSWAKKAFADAKPCGEVYEAWSGADEKFTRMPASDEIKVEPGTRYLHITSNETIGGIRFSAWPEVSVPLVADMSSEYFSRPIPWEKFDLVYGGAQKNLGPAGLAVVFICKSIVEGLNPNLSAYLRYGPHVDNQSLYNTPPMFSIWIMGKVLKWIKANGGLSAMEAAAEEKSALLYNVVEGSGGFYNSPVKASDRSQMNVVFTLSSDKLTAKFLAESNAAGLKNLKGHRSVGGCRASIYNAMPKAGVEALAKFMQEFQAANG
ncbi:3-phosphoserine/phosphohydroxythreonine transaminase [Candidatus Sumerlaeota bacterium]|nr:3-phosphoserine/phosphohydroxythreonine transaminase [Candidatus Sumerlaeota bacterium]